MGGLDPAKIFLLLVIALVVVGPERLPGAARQLGGAWRELNKLRQKFDEEVRALVPDLDLPNIPTSPSKAVTGYISGLVSGMGESTSTAGAAASETVDTLATRGGSWTGGGEADYGESGWQPLLGRQGPASPARRPPAVPLWSSVGRLSADTRSADTVFVFDEPSMN
ncbi:MAG: twin-arginine translocase TatA/TatE family subunit [Acidimicrobiales bacterium]|jgi:Sec-independent protein translocase protein TatA